MRQESVVVRKTVLIPTEEEEIVEDNKEIESRNTYTITTSVQ